MTYPPSQGNPTGWEQPVVPASAPAGPHTGGFPTGAYPPVGPPSPKNSSTKWIIGAVIGLVVVLLIGVGAIVAVGMLNRSAPAGDAVKGYLEALQRGDAKTALSYGASQPGSTELLTDEALKKQIAKAPISDIRILSDSTAKGPQISIGSVHVSVKFGDKTSDDTLFMKKSGRAWKLDNAAVNIKNYFDTPIVKVLGKTLTKGDSVYIFPGWMGIEPLTSNYSVDGDRIATLQDLLGFSSMMTTDLDVKVTESGYAAANQAVRDAIAKCAGSADLAPANCPNRIDDGDALPNTAKWAPPVMPESLGEGNFNELDAQLTYYSAKIAFPYTVQTRSGPKSDTDNAYVSIKVDLTQSPPAVKFD